MPLDEMFAKHVTLRRELLLTYTPSQVLFAYVYNIFILLYITLLYCFFYFTELEDKN